MSDSRIPGLYRLNVAERIAELQRRGWLSESDAAALRDGRHVLQPRAADKMIENVIASFALPFAIAPNFQVNGRDYIVPLVVEEPSIVAALSAAAQTARNSGGFTVSNEESLLIGQVHLSNIADTSAASEKILNEKADLLNQANAVHPRMQQRGGGVRDIEVRELELDNAEPLLVVHFLVDSCDAMGANAVNSICEAMASRLAELGGGKVAMSILSNLADRSLFTANVSYALSDLATSKDAAESVRDAIVLADRIAHADPHRAATHNKGIMNGIDALALATGNDWRAIEAGVHAYTCRDGQYSPLTRWSVAENGDLQGVICLPLKIGIVGGTLDANPASALGLGLCNVESAAELAQLMAAVGLAQNFAALRALVTTGIQKGHMRLHARSIAAAADVPEGMFDEIVSELVADGEIKQWKAREILLRHKLADNKSAAGSATASVHSACAAGKVILLGEHAVVYGKHALALPIPNAVTARVAPGQRLPSELDVGIALIARELDIDITDYAVSIESSVPRAMGLGSSAAIAVAITRAFDKAFELGLDEQRVNDVAFECEKLAHGTPSGVDNTVACFATPMLFRNAGNLEVTPIELHEALPIVIACSGSRGFTLEQVAGVRQRWQNNKDRYAAIFDEIDDIVNQGAEALMSKDYATLGALMNICHGLLNAIEVSTSELESMVSIMRSTGALGAKLTGAGGGGSVVALCPGKQDAVEAAMRAAGYLTLRLDTAGNSDDE